MRFGVTAALLANSFGIGDAHSNAEQVRLMEVQQTPIISDPNLSINGIPFSTRAHWMRQANLALNAPCPFAAFGSVIVNHTDTKSLGTLVCTGANSNSATGNPTLHGNWALPTKPSCTSY